jgi:hypothetical protein
MSNKNAIPVTNKFRKVFIRSAVDLIYYATAIALSARFMELNNDEIRRYSRHLILPEVGLQAKGKFASSV